MLSMFVGNYTLFNRIFIKNHRDHFLTCFQIINQNKMTYNKILVPYDSSKPSETALEHAIQIAKMSGISSAVNTTVNVLLLHVVKNIPVPVTFGAGLFKSKKTGDMITLEQYLKDITLEIKTDVKKMFEENIDKYRNIENVYNHKY